MKWLHLILSHCIFIAFCAAALCYETTIYLNLQPVTVIYLFVFVSTIAAYNAYYLGSHYFLNTISLRAVLRRKFSNALVMFICSACSLYLLITNSVLILPSVVAVVLILGYSLPLWSPRYFDVPSHTGFIKTALLALAWAYVTVAFPAAGSPVDMKMYALFFFGRFCFIFLLAIIFDSRDIVLDKMNGLGSLATDVSKGGMQIISAVALIFYITTGIIVNRYQGSVAQLIAWLTTSAVIIVIYLFAQKRRGYLFYYFLVDGLMLFSALTTYVATIN